jgi:hypothetical protein
MDRIDLSNPKLAINGGNLDGGTSLDGYLLKDIAKTMNTIWEGKKWIE